MSEITCEKIRLIRILSKTNKSSFELGVVKWNGVEKYDLRRWSEDGRIAYKGITVNSEELYEISKILQKALNEKKNKEPIIRSKIDNYDVSIFNDFGNFNNKKRTGKVTYTSWRENDPKYDIRGWNDDYTHCSRGVALTEEECRQLISAIQSESTYQSEKKDESSFDPSFIEKDLFI